MVKKKDARPFRYAIGLVLIAYLGMLPSTWAQSPQHSQGFNISPLQQGEFFLLSKKPAEALKVFKELWQRDPQNSYAVRGIVRSHQALKKLPEVVSLLNRYLEAHTESSPATYGLGYILYLQGNFEASKRVLNEALNLDRGNALALNTLAAVLAELKEYERALQRVREAINVAPQELMFYRNLQMIYVSSGSPDKFEEEYRLLLAEGFPEKAKRYGFILAQQLRQKSFKLYVDGKMDETIETISDMLDVYREINHEPGVVAGLFSLAVLYEEQGKVELALEKYREVLKINPQHIQAREKSRTLGSKKD